VGVHAYRVGCGLEKPLEPNAGCERSPKRRACVLKLHICRGHTRQRAGEWATAWLTERPNPVPSWRKNRGRDRPGCGTAGERAQDDLRTTGREQNTMSLTGEKTGGSVGRDSV